MTNFKKLKEKLEPYKSEIIDIFCNEIEDCAKAQRYNNIKKYLIEIWGGGVKKYFFDIDNFSEMIDYCVDIEHMSKRNIEKAYFLYKKIINHDLYEYINNEWDFEWWLEKSHKGSLQARSAVIVIRILLKGFFIKETQQTIKKRWFN